MIADITPFFATLVEIWLAFCVIEDSADVILVVNPLIDELFALTVFDNVLTRVDISDAFWVIADSALVILVFRLLIELSALVLFAFTVFVRLVTLVEISFAFCVMEDSA